MDATAGVELGTPFCHVGGEASVVPRRNLRVLQDIHESFQQAANRATPWPYWTPIAANDVAFLDEVAETILPETSTPGAKAAHTGAFMALMVTDAYPPRNQQIFRDGIADRRGVPSEYAVPFIAARPEQKLALLQRLDAERQAEVDALEGRRRSRAPAPPTLPPDAPVHYFRLMKELALPGYFTSEIGYRQAMRYFETPGRYDPCAPHKPGERIWTSHA